MTKHRFAFALLAAAALSLSLSAYAANVKTGTASTYSADVKAGRALAFNKKKGNCIACHVIKGAVMPGHVARPLVGIKKAFPNRSTLERILYDESLRDPMAPMPRLGKNHVLTHSEIEKIIDFLYTL